MCAAAARVDWKTQGRASAFCSCGCCGAKAEISLTLMSFGFECKARYSNAQTVLGASLSVGRCIKVNIKEQVTRCSMMPVIMRSVFVENSNSIQLSPFVVPGCG